MVSICESALEIDGNNTPVPLPPKIKCVGILAI
jgi:hypothetical protein